MRRVLMIQLPIPQTAFGRRTGNIPLAAAWLRQSAGGVGEILPPTAASYLADAALLDQILMRAPEIVGFSVYCWNLDRSLYLARRLRERTKVNIVFGGPEVTPDNPRLAGAPVDFLVYGEGEAVFGRLLSEPAFWERRYAFGEAGRRFETASSPYLADLLEPELENLMLLETQRGCPFRCGYCYYNKARRGVAHVDEARVLEAVDWALARDIGEVYLLDPCLSTRPGLKDLLSQLAACNREHRLGFVSEIRAEHVDTALADLFQAAGFRWFEVGLQSITPRALAAMNRPTDLKKFVRGAGLLKARGITPRIDLILGLPGDDLAGFQASVDFLVDHDLADDVQVFPLSVLPGTDFRKRSASLGLVHTPAPPYTVIETSTFAREALQQGIDYAESRLKTALYPFPAPAIAWRKPGRQEGEDVVGRIGDRAVCAKLYLDRLRPMEAIRRIAGRLAHPYQIIVDRRFADDDALGRYLTMLSGANPFTPLEVVFLEPAALPDRRRLLATVRLQRPHFLDVEQRHAFPGDGDRAVIFTLVSTDPEPRFQGAMERQLFWWRGPLPPERPDVEALEGLDGVLVDTPLPAAALEAWQDRLAPGAGDLPHIAFADLALQNRWLLKTAPEEYAAQILGTLT